MSATLPEGRSGWDLHQIDYPNINSCITITAFKGKALAGAHFVLNFQGTPRKLAPDVVWGKLKTELKAIPFGSVSAVYVLGSLGSWMDPAMTYRWPTSFKHDLADTFGVNVACYKWDSQDDSSETRLIRITRGVNGAAAISYGKWSDEHLVGPMKALDNSKLRPFPLA